MQVVPGNILAPSCTDRNNPIFILSSRNKSLDLVLKAPNFEWKASELMCEFTRNRSSEWMAGFIARRLLVANTHQTLFSSMKGDLEKAPDSDVSLTPWHGGYKVVLVSGGSFRFSLVLAHLFGIVDRDHPLTPGFRDWRFQIAGAFVTWMKQPCLPLECQILQTYQDRVRATEYPHPRSFFVGTNLQTKLTFDGFKMSRYLRRLVRY